MATTREIPTAHTPAGGYGPEMPPPILAACTEPLAPGVPDLRGTWRIVELTAGGVVFPPEHGLWRHVERIEQAADRVVITSDGVIHDMYADGTDDNGVHDVMALDFTTEIVVAASFEDGALVLRPHDLPSLDGHRPEVRRWLDGDHLMWSYLGVFTARLSRDPA
jgi:hypothetical protein